MPAMELFDLHGKVAIVTGGNGGIGLGIARGLAQAGADIVVAARNPDKTSAAVEQLGGLGVRALGVQVDVTDASQIQKMVADTVDALGGVDILVANAGMSIRKRPETYSIDEWLTVINTNLTGVFACCHAVHPQFATRRGGKILTISGFYFDVEEVLHAKGNVKKIKALIEKANKEFKAIQDKVTFALKGFQRLQNFLVTREAAARKEIENKRRERDDLIRQYSYSLIQPVAWKLVDDYSRFVR